LGSIPRGQQRLRCHESRLSMANISGKVTAITVLTPMRPWKRVILQVLFRLVSWGFYSSIQQKLVKLSFIHFANWSVIRRSDFPHLDPDQPVDRPRYDYGSHYSAKQPITASCRKNWTASCTLLINSSPRCATTSAEYGVSYGLLSKSALLFSRGRVAWTVPILKVALHLADRFTPWRRCSSR
jgi:hypothetical protein